MLEEKKMANPSSHSLVGGREVSLLTIDGPMKLTDGGVLPFSCVPEGLG